MVPILDFQSCEIVAPRNLKVSNKDTMLFRMEEGGSSGWGLLKSTVISTVLGEFRSRLF